MELKDYIGVLKRRWKPFLLIFFVCVGALFGYNYFIDKVKYQAVATIQIGVGASGQNQENYWRSQVQFSTEIQSLTQPRVKGFAVKHLPIACLVRAIDQTDTKFQLWRNADAAQSAQQPPPEPDQKKVFVANRDATRNELKKFAGALALLAKNANVAIAASKEKAIPEYREVSGEWRSTGRMITKFPEYEEKDGEWRPKDRELAALSDGREHLGLRAYLVDHSVDLGPRNTFANTVLAEFNAKGNAPGVFAYRYTATAVPQDLGIDKITQVSTTNFLSITKVDAEKDVAVLHAFATQLAAGYHDFLAAQSQVVDRVDKLRKKITEFDQSIVDAEAELKKLKTEVFLPAKVSTEGEPADALAKELSNLKVEVDSHDRRMNEIRNQGRLKEEQQREVMDMLTQARVSGRDWPATANTSALQQDSTVTRLRGELEALTQDYGRLAKTYTPDHQRMRDHMEKVQVAEQSLQRQIVRSLSDQNRQLGAEIDKLNLSLKVEEEGARELKSREEQIRAIQGLHPRAGDEYDKHRAEQTRLKEERKKFQSELGTLDVQQKTTRGAYVLNAMNYDGNEIAKETNQIRVIGVIISLLLALGVVALWEYLDREVRTEYDVRRYLNLPVLAVVPELRGEVLLTDVEVRSKVSELFNTAATLIRSHAKELSLRSFVVSSANPKEGKTTISVNLAVAMARKGVRVCLIDADLRRPQLHSIFGLRNIVGLSTLVEGKLDAAGAGGERSYEECVQKTEIDNLDVVTSGASPPDPVALLESDRLKTLLGELTHPDGYEVVLLDTPPIGSVGDTLILSQLVDANIFIVGAGQVDYAEVTAAKRLLTNIHARILGVILNKAQERRSKEYYYYYSDDTRRVGHIR